MFCSFLYKLFLLKNCPFLPDSMSNRMWTIFDDKANDMLFYVMNMQCIVFQNFSVWFFFLGDNRIYNIYGVWNVSLYNLTVFVNGFFGNKLLMKFKMLTSTSLEFCFNFVNTIKIIIVCTNYLFVNSTFKFFIFQFQRLLVDLFLQYVVRMVSKAKRFKWQYEYMNYIHKKLQCHSQHLGGIIWGVLKPVSEQICIIFSLLIQMFICFKTTAIRKQLFRIET